MNLTRKHLNIAIAVLIIFGLFQLFGNKTNHNPQSALDFELPEHAIQIQENYTPSLNIVAKTVKPNSLLYDDLIALNLSPTEIHYLTKNFKKVFNFKYIRPGHKYTVYINSESNKIHKFKYEKDPLNVYMAVRTTGNAYSVFKESVFVNKKTESLTCTINNSLYQDLVAKGETAQLVMEFADIFSYDIDFFLYPRKGDVINLLYEKYYKDDKFYRYGKILTAQYIGREKFSAIRFSRNNKDSFFDLNGKPLQKMFLRMPVKFGVMTSPFTYKRMHPILGYTRKHTGIDYGARHGSAIHATADGYVIFSGWYGGYGKLVKIRHNNGYVTYYGHCSKNIAKKGQYVKQGQTIARVGSTGYSTGPHVHYEVRINGTKAINPLTLKTKRKNPLNGTQLAAFKKEKNKYLSMMEYLKLPVQGPEPSTQKVSLNLFQRIFN